jgi:MFS family permease
MSDVKWITRDFLIAWVMSFLLAATFYLFMVTTSGYAIGRFGASTALAGLSTSIAVLSAIVTRPITGRVIFRIGCIRTLTIGFVSSLLLSICYFFTSSIGVLIAVRIVHGLCIGVAGTSIFTVGSLLVPKNKSGIGMGLFSLSATIGVALGPFLATALSNTGNYIAIYTATATGAALDVCLIMFIRLKNVRLDAPGLTVKPAKGLARFMEPAILPAAVIAGLAYSVYGCIVAFLSVSTRGTGLEHAAAYFFILYAAGILCSRPITGRVFDRHGENPMMYAGLAILAAGMLLTGLARNGASLLAAAFLDGAGLGAVLSVTLSIGVKYTPPERLGMANSTYYIFLDAGLTAGPVLGGILVPYIGYAGIYALGMPVALFGILLYYIIHGRSHRPASAL